MAYSSSNSSDSEGDNTLDFAYSPKRRWTHLEDAQLTLHVLVNGRKMWRKIAERLPTRSTHACRVRWSNYLQPGVRDSPFNRMEELQLMFAQSRQRNLMLRRRINDDLDFHRSTASMRLMNPSAIMSAMGPAAVSPARSSVDSSGTMHLSRTSGYKCLPCRLNCRSDGCSLLKGERAFMADCGVCKRVLEKKGREMVKVKKEISMESTGTLDQKPPVIDPKVKVELSLATTVYAPSPPPPPPPPTSSPPPASFIDFLGVGSV